MLICSALYLCLCIMHTIGVERLMNLWWVPFNCFNKMCSFLSVLTVNLIFFKTNTFVKFIWTIKIIHLEKCVLYFTTVEPYWQTFLNETSHSHRNRERREVFRTDDVLLISRVVDSEAHFHRSRRLRRAGAYYHRQCCHRHRSTRTYQ